MPTMTETIARMNARDERATHAMYVNDEQVDYLLNLAGATRDDRGRWVFPDGFKSWCRDEAGTYALYSLTGKGC